MQTYTSRRQMLVKPARQTLTDNIAVNIRLVRAQQARIRRYYQSLFATRGY